VGQNYGPIFLPLCEPKYTRLGQIVHETLQFATQFSVLGLRACATYDVVFAMSNNNKNNNNNNNRGFV